MFSFYAPFSDVFGGGEDIEMEHRTKMDKISWNIEKKYDSL